MTSLADNPVQREETSSGHPGSINVPVLTNVISKGVDTAEGRSRAGAPDGLGQETEACSERARHLLCNHHTVYFILHNVPCSPLSVLSSHCVFSGAQQRAKYKLCGGCVPCLPLFVQSSYCVFSGAHQLAKYKLRGRWGCTS